MRFNSVEKFCLLTLSSDRRVCVLCTVYCEGDHCDNHPLWTGLCLCVPVLTVTLLLSNTTQSLSVSQSSCPPVLLTTFSSQQDWDRRMTRLVIERHFITSHTSHTYFSEISFIGFYYRKHSARSSDVNCLLL